MKMASSTSSLTVKSKSASTLWPSSRPSSLFVAPTGPADETSPPIFAVSRLKLPVIPSKNNSSSSFRNKSNEYLSQGDSSNQFVQNYNADSMNAINSATYMFYTFVIVFVIIVSCNFYRK